MSDHIILRFVVVFFGTHRKTGCNELKFLKDLQRKMNRKEGVSQRVKELHHFALERRGIGQKEYLNLTRS